jgi:hypothetical protein
MALEPVAFASSQAYSTLPIFERERNSSGGKKVWKAAVEKW